MSVPIKVAATAEYGNCKMGKAAGFGKVPSPRLISVVNEKYDKTP